MRTIVPVIIVGLALLFDFTGSFRDAAEPIATIVFTNVLSQTVTRAVKFPDCEGG